MKVVAAVAVVLTVCGWGLEPAGAAEIGNADVAATIQAIQQATDPSAVVAAYANGFNERSNVQLHSAYVTRMTDLGLPELAYHQAQTVVGLDGKNGIAWGVVAYVDARRGDMPNAISSIALASQYAPENRFVQRTAGEILAWYDVRAEKAKVPANAKLALVKLKERIGSRAGFTEAYAAASKAYAGQTNTSPTPSPPTAPVPSPLPTQSLEPRSGLEPSSPGPVVQALPPANEPDSSGYLPPMPAPVYYPPDYSYNWGLPYPVDYTGWWYPTGYFYGYNYFPGTDVVFFGGRRFFHHHDRFDHDRDRDHLSFGRSVPSGTLGFVGRPNSVGDPAAITSVRPAVNRVNNTPTTRVSDGNCWGLTGPHIVTAGSAGSGGVQFVRPLNSAVHVSAGSSFVQTHPVSGPPAGSVRSQSYSAPAFSHAVSGGSHFSGGGFHGGGNHGSHFRH